MHKYIGQVTSSLIIIVPLSVDGLPIEFSNVSPGIILFSANTQKHVTSVRFSNCAKDFLSSPLSWS